MAGGVTSENVRWDVTPFLYDREVSIEVEDLGYDVIAYLTFTPDQAREFIEAIHDAIIEVGGGSPWPVTT